MITAEVFDRIKKVKLWSKQIYFDMVITKWQDLWPEDFYLLSETVENLNRMPSTAEDYRRWLRGENYA